MQRTPGRESGHLETRDSHTSLVVFALSHKQEHLTQPKTLLIGTDTDELYSSVQVAQHYFSFSPYQALLSPEGNSKAAPEPAARFEDS